MSELVWIFGNGASKACGLDWEVPNEYKSLDRESQISRIKKDMEFVIKEGNINLSLYKILFLKLEKQTKRNWKHFLVTTNWDTLLEKAIESLNLDSVPQWLLNTHVFHLNGSIESAEGDICRSPFLLETDTPQYRKKSIEGNKSFKNIIWSQYFVVVGLSFSYEIDRTLLYALSNVQDNLPVGESQWIIIDNDKLVLDRLRKSLSKLLPNADFCSMPPIDFKIWVKTDMKELNNIGVFNEML